MANSGADIYLILLRPSRVPVAGEAVSHLFQGQVMLDTLSWNLHNEDEVKLAEARDAEFTKTKNLVDRSGSAALRAEHARDEQNRQYKKLLKASQKEGGMSEEKFKTQRDALDRNYARTVAEIYGRELTRNAEEIKAWEKEQAAQTRSDQIAEADRNRNFEITFTKRVDIASTQMLNSMKAGDIFPSGTLTIHKRSATVMDGTSLVFTIQKIRLLDYQLQVVVTDTMTEMVEEWTAEFGALAYVYKNPPSHYTHSGAAQAAAKSATQGTTRAFTMRNIGSPI